MIRPRLITVCLVTATIALGTTLVLGTLEALHRISIMTRQQEALTADLELKMASQTFRLDRLSEIVTLSEQHGAGFNHTDVRIAAIKSQIAQASDPVVIVGDSITEGALLPSNVCGKTVINAGVGGTDVGSYGEIAKQILSAQPVALIVVALGTNNSTRSSVAADGFAASYAALLDELTPHTRKLLIAGIPGVDMTGALASQYMDQASADRHNGDIMDVARQRATEFIDLHSESVIGKTNDGVHLNAAGYKPWASAIIAAISVSLGCANNRE